MWKGWRLFVDTFHVPLVRPGGNRACLQGPSGSVTSLREYPAFVAIPA